MAKTILEVERELSPNLMTATELSCAYERGAIVKFEDEDGHIVTVPTFEEAAQWFASYNASLGTVYYPFSISEATKYISPRQLYRWESPHQWLVEKTAEWTPGRLLQEFYALAQKLDADAILNLYRDEMDVDGYFTPLELEHDYCGD